MAGAGFDGVGLCNRRCLKIRRPQEVGRMGRGLKSNNISLNLGDLIGI